MDRALTLAALFVLVVAVILGPAASLLPAGAADADGNVTDTPAPDSTRTDDLAWATTTPTPVACSAAYQSLPTVRDRAENVTVVFLAGDGIELGTATLEVADEPGEWQTGLMNRTSLAPDGGMLFVFPDEDRRTFWMKDTLVALDMLFVTEDGRVVQISHAEPEPGVADEDLRRYNSGEPVQYVVELPAGTVDWMGIETGAQVVVATDETC
jgi:uncharacterized membrane protein (UPF0127 family)